ncbi:MAG TPA: hypothetical protein VK445_08785, partial [Dissulfurispiraceae bacterium]|nr:hypothetical protein [Dissulfurispiraceae bacterium]
GWFGVFDGDFPHPVEEPALIDRFCADFPVERLCKPGLSVVVPYPDSSITALRLISSVLVHYFFPIIGGALSVEIALDSRSMVISRESIDALLHQLSFDRAKVTKENLLALFQMSRWAHGIAAEKHILLKRPNQARAPEWNEGLFDEKGLALLRTAFEEGKPVAVRVPLRVQRPKFEPEDTFFSVYVQRDDSLDVPQDYFVRSGVTIAGVKSLRKKGVRAIVVIDDIALSALLGDSENPAHTEWQERSPKFRGKYVRGASCLRFVKNSPRELVRILTTPVQGKDDVLLKDVFSLGLSAHPEAVRTLYGSSPAGRDRNGYDDLASSRPRYLVVTPIGSGFRVAGSGTKNWPTRQFVIDVAYLIRRGDPFARYCPLDFELDREPIAVTAEEVVVNRIGRNRIQGEIIGDDFVLELAGFDPNRDLVVRAELVEGSGA